MRGNSYDKLVVVTRKTALEELVERFNSEAQARFYIEHMGGSFSEYQEAHEAYRRAAAALRDAIPRGVRSHWIERSFLPTYSFGNRDLVVTLGPDGLVVNTAKYLHEQPLLAINPDPERIDGVLARVPIDSARVAVLLAIESGLLVEPVTMAQATLNDGQSLLAVNDLFIGARTHVSARYEIRLGERSEAQSSSGIIVSTGVGSSGWLRSVLTGAAGIVKEFVSNATEVARVGDSYHYPWSADQLIFAVREPFISKTSSADLVYGIIQAPATLEIVSRMPRGGVIFSDGIEEDYLAFESGAVATIGVAERRLHLMAPPRTRVRGAWNQPQAWASQGS